MNDVAAKLFRNMTARNPIWEFIMKPPHQQRMRGYKIAKDMAAARRIGYKPKGNDPRGTRPLQTRGQDARQHSGQGRRSAGCPSGREQRAAPSGRIRRPRTLQNSPRSILLTSC